MAVLASRPVGEWLQVTYRVRSTPDRIDARAEAIALEQSIEMPMAAVTNDWVRGAIAGRVEAISPDQGAYRVVIGLSAVTVGDNRAQLLSMIFGNVSLQDDVELVDLHLPPSILAAFAGPSHGIEGIRALAGVEHRALTCSALKPQGAPADELADLCRRLAGAGIDLIKDDHGLADQATAPFARRVEACQRAILASGTTAVYAPSVVGGPRRMTEQLHIAVDHGVRVVLVAPMVAGLPAFAELASDHPHVAFLAHPALAGTTRIAPAVALGLLFRAYGADAVIFPNHGGRFGYSPGECADLARAARDPWEPLRPTLPVPAGGMSVERVDEMLEFYGRDVMLLISGDLLSAPNVAQRARRFVDAVRR